MVSMLCISCDGIGGKHPGQNADSKNITLEMYGMVIHKYNSSNWQMSYSDTEKKFSVFLDDMSEFYTMHCEEIPQKEGQYICGCLTWKHNHRLIEKKGYFKVVGIGQDGLIRLYCAEGDIYVTIKLLYE